MEQSKSCSESQGFARAFSTYNRYRKSLKRIYQETCDLYRGNACGVKANEYLDLEHKKLTVNEDTLLQNTIRNPISIVVLGQTYKAKCLFVNKLLGQEILPVHNKEWLKYCRMTKLKYGVRPQLSISFQDSYVIVEPRLHTSSNEETVDWTQEFALLEEDLKQIDGGVVEITIHHQMVRGSQIIMCSGEGNMNDVVLSSSSTDHTDSDTGPSSALGIIPIFIYAMENEDFTWQETQNLTALQAQYPDNAVLFCFVDPLDHLKERENEPPVSHYIPGENRENRKENQIEGILESQTTSYENSSMTIGGIDSVDVLPLSKSNATLVPDFCINKFNRTSKQMSSTKSIGISSKSAKSIEQSSSVYCVHHSAISTTSQDVVRSLYHAGFHFCCTCKGGLTPLTKKQDREFEESGYDSEIAETCTRTNAGYVAMNLFMLTDTRLKGFPPSSIYLNCQTHEDKLISRILSFVRCMAKYYLVRAAKAMHRLHTGILNNSIHYAFQMSRDLMITPKRVEYVRQQENSLFTQLVEISTQKSLEIQELISGIKVGLRDKILNAAENYTISDEDNSFRRVFSVKREIQDLVLTHIKLATAERLYDSIQLLRESYTGTLSRCLECLESSVEESGKEVEGSTSKHFKKILHVAYNVELNIQSSSSLAKVMIDKLRQLLTNLPWHQPPIMDKSWRRNIASDVLTSLDESRLAKSICSQFRSRLCQSHSAFLTSLRHLESLHQCRLEHTEENRHNVAKIVAPHIARLALESTSVIDSVLYGMPRMGREIGRGMYGVVYQCDSWSTWSPCAVKSVAPPDEKHANDLSLEFYYTRCLPEHPRIVQIRGSIVDETYAGGIGPSAVLLIMDRMHCDLYTAIKRGLAECNRMQVAVDVIEGIRFLHSQGLVHRDIKLKNVLLDRRNRAKITDLGFCKPGAMMSGSIVGTPIHMPPELFTGKYDSSVDVYAFGILFWYLCAGVTRLPKNFETCTTKDHLWTAVRKGVRPERLNKFSEDCWQLMKACWHNDPSKRPLLGKIHPKLIEIHTRLKATDNFTIQ